MIKKTSYKNKQVNYLFTQTTCTLRNPQTSLNIYVFHTLYELVSVRPSARNLLYIPSPVLLQRADVLDGELAFSMGSTLSLLIILVLMEKACLGMES
jgi:uncharacterized protein YjbK